MEFHEAKEAGIPYPTNPPTADQSFLVFCRLPYRQGIVLVHAVENATWVNGIGATELGAIWTDPDFDPKQAAFYCARVIEIPAPRWSTYDAYRFGVDIPEGAPTSTRERAYTSPIWYTP